MTTTSISAHVKRKSSKKKGVPETSPDTPLETNQINETMK
jgi:hypothetical protein